MSGAAASSIEVRPETIYIVNGGPFVGDVVVRSEFVKEVDGCVFCMLQYTKGPAARLMQGRLSKGKRPLCQSGVIDELKELAVLAYVRAEADEIAAEDVRLHLRRKGRNAVAFQVISICAPAVGSASETVFKVLSNGYRTAPLWFELTAAAVDYLQQAFAASDRDQETDGAKFSQAKNRWYVETVASDKRKARKFFHTKDAADRHVRGEEADAAEEVAAASDDGGSPIMANVGAE